MCVISKLQQLNATETRALDFASCLLIQENFFFLFMCNTVTSKTRNGEPGADAEHHKETQDPPLSRLRTESASLRTTLGAFS